MKEKGRIADLRAAVDSTIVASTGIGHTRWATHGVPNQRNAHPHQSASNRFTLVHNDVIEDSHTLQQDYLQDVPMNSDTDTEVIVQLIEKFVNEGMAPETAFRHSLSLLHGSYAIAMVDAEEAATIFVAKNKSPFEFGYNMPLLSEKPLFLFITQSGETADSRQVLVKIKALGYPSITLTNVPGSTLSREADHTLLLHAGPEIAVASTKAYTAQLATLAIAAYVVANVRGKVVDFDLKNALAISANAIQTLVDAKEELEQIAQEFLAVSRNAFFIARNLDFYVSLEGKRNLLHSGRRLCWRRIKTRDNGLD